MCFYQIFEDLILEAVVANHHNSCVWGGEDLNLILEPDDFSTLF